MLGWWWSLGRLGIEIFEEDVEPRRVGAGVALGVAIGLVPKDNLVALVLACVLYTIRVNVPLGTLAAVATSAVAIWLDPLAHLAGAWLLENESLRPVWETLAAAPIVPWTRFDNTVAMGSFVLALLAFGPVHWSAAKFTAAYGPGIGRWWRSTRWGRRATPQDGAPPAGAGLPGRSTLAEGST